MPAWDRGTPQQQAKVRDAALRRQLRDRVGPFSPFWRERFTALKVPAASINGVGDLAKLPAVGERDVCPSGDPRDAARLVLQADEAGFALHAFGPDLRKALVKRAGGKESYRRQVEAEVRPTTFHFGGRAMRFPVASTRNDLDAVARAGNRAWTVLGLTAADVLVSAVPTASSLDHLFLTYAAIGAGAPALFPGSDPAAVNDALRLVPATVLAVRPEDAADLLDDLDTTSIRTVLLVGAATPEQREAAASVPDATVLGLWGPEEGRVMWAECRESAGSPTGWHTYPDLDYVELVDPETGKPSEEGGELVVTQLGFSGSALLRWRTGDIVDGPIETSACPACRRTVPRVPTNVTRNALQVTTALRGAGDTTLDLRAVTGALAGRRDLADWMVEIVPSGRDGANDLFVLIAPSGDETDAAVGAYRDVRAVAGVTPSQVVVLAAEDLAARRDGGGPRVVVRG